MNDAMTRSEQLFGLSVAGGRCTARPGETVTFAFALRNEDACASRPATLVFVLQAPWSALDPCEVAVAPLAPGDARRVLLRAVAGDVNGGAVSTTVQAELHVDGRVFGSNRVEVRIAGQPCFTGPGSGIAIAPDGAEAFVVGVSVRNEGDAPARDVRIVVPVPPGFAGIDVPGPVVRDVLAPGDAVAFSYRIVPTAALPARVCVDDAAVAYDGVRCALPTRTPLEAHPAIAAPELLLERRATRLDVRLRIANDGWAAAYDLPCTLALAPGWRIARGSLLVDGEMTAVRSDGDVHALAVPFLAPRSVAEIVAVATATKPRTGPACGEVVVTCAGMCTAQPVPEPARGAVRIGAQAAAAHAEPGTSVAVAIDIRGAGERSEHVRITLDGTPCWNGDLRPGVVTRIAGAYMMPATCSDGDTVTVAVLVCDADGTMLAETAFSVRTVDRPWLAIAGIAGDGDATTVTLRNDGATSVREIRFAGDDAVAIPALSPGESAALVLDASRAHDGAVVAHGVQPLALCAATCATFANAAATLRAPGNTQSGERCEVHVHVHAVAAMRSLHVRAHVTDDAAYVAGSTLVNGCAVIDGIAGSPLFHDAGLALHAVPAGHGVDVSWSILPHRSGDHMVTAGVSVNGVPLDVAPLTVTVADSLPFGARTHALPFHIDAPTVHDRDVAPEPDVRTRLEALPPPPEPSEPQAFALPALLGITTALDLEPSRCAAIARVLRGSRGPGIIGHLPALAALFPSAIASGDIECDAAFALLARSVCGIYERLFVKLRIPGYDVTSADLDDAATRNALLTLFGRLDTAPGIATSAGDERTRITAAIAQDRIAHVRTVLAAATDDAPYSLAAIALLLPRSAISGVAGAIGSYAALLADALEAACEQPANDVVAALCTFDARELDAARTVAIAVLGAAGEPAPL